MKRSPSALALIGGLMGGLVFSAAAARAEEAPHLAITRAAGAITIDGDLSDPGWKNALRFDTWYETNPGDNVEPKWKTTGWMTYDDRFFYVAIESFDPDPSAIRAQLGDHDGINGNSDDFAGVILDTRNDGKTGLELFANAAGTQFDAVVDDAAGNEDASPDVFWDSSVKRTDRGWILELRVPFSSLRYEKGDPQTWGAILYRNVPRARRYQLFTHKLPRGSNCFVCNYNKIDGFTGLPTGGHIVAAPYITAKENGELRESGNQLVNRPARGDGGIDVKWTPNAHTAIDGTLNPDFSQIESDVAAISTNERFAIFFPEKRPFFLERVELLSTPLQPVYTRTITSPRFGLRDTSNYGRDSFTLLVAEDRGGGSVIIPSAQGSDFAHQDFSSLVGIGRWRHDVGKTSFVSFLGTTRESEGGAYNRVLGPDFQWKPNDSNTVTGQLLVSDTRTPNRPELASEWDGRRLTSHAEDLWWSYSNPKFDFFTEALSFGDKFRANNGFVPQVGYRMNYLESGYTVRPKGFFSRLRAFGNASYSSEQDGSMLGRGFSAGFGGDGKFRSSIRLRYALETVRNGNDLFQQHRLFYNLTFNVSKVISQVSFSGWAGQAVDFANSRLGRGASVNLGTDLRITKSLLVNLTNAVQWLNERPSESGSGHLFTSQAERLRAQYMFSPRTFLRAIVQNQRTSRNPDLYSFDVRARRGSLASQLLFGYRVNWQSVLFLGYGDLRDVADNGDFQKSKRQLFMKLSYAFQR